MMESQTMLNLIARIGIILMKAGPIVILIFVLQQEEKKRNKYILKYLDTHKCKKCNKRKKATHMMMNFTSFKMYCENEDCQNYGRHTRHNIEHEQEGILR